MLELFIAVALDPLKKCGEGKLLLVAKLGLLLLDHGLHLYAKKNGRGGRICKNSTLYRVINHRFKPIIQI